MTKVNGIPIVSIGDLSRGDKGAAKKVLEAFVRFGLVFISGTKLTPGFMEQFYRQWLPFARRPLDEIKYLIRPDIAFQRGFSPPNTERAIAAGGQPDYKVNYFAGVSDAEQRLKWPMLFEPNVWPSDLPNFGGEYLAINDSCGEVAYYVISALELALGLTQGSISLLATRGPHIGRAIYYLPLDEAEASEGRIWAENHTDFNMVTVLPPSRFVQGDEFIAKAPDDRVGLYLKTRDGKEVSGIAPQGCITVQLGQQLEIILGGRALATEHGVRAPSTPGIGRSSFAYFHHMGVGCELAPFPEFEAEAGGRYNPPKQVGAYDFMTLYQIGLLTLDQLIGLLGYPNQVRVGRG